MIFSIPQIAAPRACYQEREQQQQQQQQQQPQQRTCSAANYSTMNPVRRMDSGEDTDCGRGEVGGGQGNGC